MSSLTPFALPSCLVILKKNEKKLTSEGRDKKEGRLEFASDVIPFKDFNKQLKELIKDVYPMDTFTIPFVEINGEVVTPKSGPIIIKNQGVIVNVKLTTAKSMDNIGKKAKDAKIHQAKLAKVKEYVLQLFVCNVAFFRQQTWKSTTK